MKSDQSTCKQNRFFVYSNNLNRKQEIERKNTCRPTPLLPQCFFFGSCGWARGYISEQHVQNVMATLKDKENRIQVISHNRLEYF